MIGSTISHYKITEKLGEGGMGVVYKAEDTKLKRSVALKFPAPHLLQDEEARKRFEREATAAAGLSHPNICTVHEISDEGGQTFLAMEFIEGESLDAKIERGPLSLKEALGFARQVAAGLAAAHAKGVVHRDIKPGNLLVTPEGGVKILDFGLALLTEGSKLTKLDTTVGTVAYMSPEQAQGMEVDYRSDIWALGCVTENAPYFAGSSRLSTLLPRCSCRGSASRSSVVGRRRGNLLSSVVMVLQSPLGHLSRLHSVARLRLCLVSILHSKCSSSILASHREPPGFQGHESRYRRVGFSRR